MTKHIRQRVVRFETRPNTGPEDSRRLWPLCSSAVLECGHVQNLGVGTDYRPKRMACQECGPRQRTGRDGCEVCHGAKGGVRGNENVVDSVVICDYCHAEKMRDKEAL